MTQIKNKEKIEQDYKIENHNELPLLFISKTKTINDFETEKIEIQSRGLNMEETITGFKYLLNKALKKLEAKK